MFRAIVLCIISIIAASAFISGCEDGKGRDRRGLSLFSGSYSRIPILGGRVEMGPAPKIKDTDEVAVKHSPDSDEQEEPTEYKIMGFEAEEIGCKKFPVGHDQTGATSYRVCRPIGAEFYFIPELRGDAWGIGSKLPTYFTTGKGSRDQLYLWRSSYNRIAPQYCSHGYALNEEACPICSRLNYSGDQRYADLAYAARYMDDGLYYFENGTLGADDFRTYMTASTRFMRTCQSDNVLKGLFETIVGTVEGSFQNTAFYVMDRLNQVRYGCPSRGRTYHYCQH